MPLAIIVPVEANSKIPQAKTVPNFVPTPAQYLVEFSALANLRGDENGAFAGEMAVVRLERNISCGVLEAVALLADQAEVGDIANVQLFRDLRHLEVQPLIGSDAVVGWNARVVFLDRDGEQAGEGGIVLHDGAKEHDPQTALLEEGDSAHQAWNICFIPASGNQNGIDGV